MPYASHLRSLRIDDAHILEAAICQTSSVDRSAGCPGTRLGVREINGAFLGEVGIHRHIKQSALADCMPTLPLRLALKMGTNEQRAVVRTSIEQGGAPDLPRITAAIESTGGLAYTARLARREASLAIESLAGFPDSAYRQALRELADFAVDRTY